MRIYQSKLIFAALFVALAVGIALMLTPAPSARASSPIIVNTTLDETDASDGKCSLREAIIAANTNIASGGTLGECAAGSPGMDTINITATGTMAILGYLPNITDTLTINVPAGKVTISGSGVTRSGFSLNDNVTLNLNSLNIADGYFPGGFGGAITLGAGAQLNISNSTFSNNYSGYSGGAIDNSVSATSSVSITNSTFYSNTAGPNPGLGGAIYSFSPLTITNSTFYSNSVIGNGCCSAGGAIYIYSSTLAITNSTFANNTTSGAGSAIYTSQITNTTTIVNGTFAGNGGGGALFTNGTTIFRNTIVANSLGSNCSGTMTNGGNNIDSGTSCGWGTTNGSMSSTDPKLGPFANLGGLTKVLGLISGSPAINGVTFNSPNGAPSTDQRGFPRPVGGGYDIGAFEGTLYPLYLPLIVR